MDQNRASTTWRANLRHNLIVFTVHREYDLKVQLNLCSGQKVWKSASHNETRGSALSLGVSLHAITCRLDSASLHLRSKLFPKRHGWLPAQILGHKRELLTSLETECTPVQVAAIPSLELYLLRLRANARPDSVLWTVMGRAPRTALDLRSPQPSLQEHTHPHAQMCTQNKHKHPKCLHGLKDNSSSLILNGEASANRKI